VSATQFEALVRLLIEQDVEFVLVGGLAATVHGSAYATYDVDVSYGRSTANVERLCRACGLTITPPRRGSHFKVRDPQSGTTLTIPAHRPIRAVYIRALVALADRFREGKDGQ